MISLLTSTTVTDQAKRAQEQALEQVLSFKKEDTLVSGKVISVLSAASLASRSFQSVTNIWQVLWDIGNTQQVADEQKQAAAKLWIKYAKKDISALPLDNICFCAGLRFVVPQRGYTKTVQQVIQKLYSPSTPAISPKALYESFRTLITLVQNPKIPHKILLEILQALPYVLKTLRANPYNPDFHDVATMYMAVVKPPYKEDEATPLLDGIVLIIDGPLSDRMRNQALSLAWEILKSGALKDASHVWKWFWDMMCFQPDPVPGDIEPAEDYNETERARYELQNCIANHWIGLAQEALKTKKIDDKFFYWTLSKVIRLCGAATVQNELEFKLSTIIQALIATPTIQLSKVLGDIVSVLFERKDLQFLQDTVIKYTVNKAYQQLNENSDNDAYAQLAQGLSEIIASESPAHDRYLAVSTLLDMCSREKKELPDTIFEYATSAIDFRLTIPDDKLVEKYVTMLQRASSSCQDTISFGKICELGTQLLAITQNIDVQKKIIDSILSAYDSRRNHGHLSDAVFDIMSFLSQQELSVFMDLEAIKQSTDWSDEWKKMTFSRCQSLIKSR